MKYRVSVKKKRELSYIDENNVYDVDNSSSEDFNNYGDDGEDDTEDGDGELPIMTNIVQQGHHVPRITWLDIEEYTPTKVSN